MKTRTERVPGDLGTVEGHYRAQGGRRYRTSSEPPRMHETAVTAQGAAPSPKTRAKLHLIDTQQTANDRPKRKSKTRPQWAQLVGITRDSHYGIRVKLRGIPADVYWLPYAKASQLFYEVTGYDLADEVAEL